MSGPDIFISYNREDAAHAKRYADAFAEAGLTVWWDATLRSGEDYDAVTEEALRTAKSVVVLWSPRSVNSRWVRAEATIADRGQTLMPVMIEQCDRPVMFELKQTSDLSHWRGDTSDKDWQAFVADVRRKVGRAGDDSSAAPSPKAAAPAAASAADDRAAVAVLPFGFRANDAELELQAEDLTEDVTRELAYNRYFRVIAAGTMAAWRGQAIDHKSLGQKLGARYLIEGKLQRSSGAVRLTVQLIDGNSGNVLWSTRMAADSAGGELSADAVPVAAAAQVAEQLVQREQTRVMGKRAPFSAWDHILRTTAYSRRSDHEGARLAVEEARLAVAAGPDIGLAHAQLASAIAALSESQGIAPDEEQIKEIQARTRQAMRLDGNNPTVLMALAQAYQGLGENEICLRLARRAVELWPSSPSSHQILGDSYRMLGRTAEAVDAYRKQDELAPYDSTRYVALSNLGMCLLLEGQADEAEAALDRALILDPEYPVALEWKAIVSDALGKPAAALDAMRQLRAIEAETPLDRYVWQIERYTNLRERTAPHTATLRRLWRAAGPDAELDEEVQADTEADALVESPASKRVEDADVSGVIEDVALAALQVEEPDPVPEQPALQSAALTGTVVAEPPSGQPPAKTPDPELTNGDETADPLLFGGKENRPAPDTSSDYVTAVPAPAVAANDDVQKPAPPAQRKSALPRVAALIGVVALVGAGAVAMTGGKDTAEPASNEVSAFAAATVPTALPDIALPEPSGDLVAHPLDGAVSQLIAASRAVKRPAAELAALEAGRQAMLPLIAKLQATPADPAIDGQLKTIATGLVQQQGAALNADADRWLRVQQQQALSAKHSLAPEVAAKVDRALDKLRSNRAGIGAALASAGQAKDAAGVLGAGRNAVQAFGRLQAAPVAQAIASAKAAAVASAAADKVKQANHVSRLRVELETARTEVSRLSSQIAGLTQQEKPGLFASSAKRQSFKLRKDNADRSRALSVEADQIVAQSNALTDAAALDANLSRLRGLRSQASTLLASSNAALKSAAAAPDEKATAPAKK